MPKSNVFIQWPIILIGAVAFSRRNFWFKSGLSKKHEEEKFDNSEKFEETKSPFFCFIYLALLTFELSNIYWKCLENCNMLTERNYDSVVFKIDLNIIKNLRFYWAIINWHFIRNIAFNNGVYCDLHNKSDCVYIIFVWHLTFDVLTFYKKYWFQ